MTIFRSDAVRNALMDALDTIRGVSVQIQLRTLVSAIGGGTGVLIAELTGDATSWADASAAGVLTSNAISPDVSANSTNLVGHYELLTQASVWLESGVVDLTGATDGVAIDNLSIEAGQTVQMSGNWVNTAAYPNA